MLHTRHLLIALSAVALMLAMSAAAAAQSPSTAQPQLRLAERKTPRPNEPPRVAWAPTRLTQALKPGQTVQVAASFTSNTALSNLTLRITGDLAKIVQASSTKFAQISGGTSTTVVFTITMPPRKAHQYSGVVQLLAGKRLLGEPLHILVGVQKDNAATPEPTRKPAATRTPTPPAYPAPLPQ